MWLKTVHSALNCKTFQGLSRDEFLFGINDKAVNMLCVIVKMYICETRGQEKQFFIETLLKRIFICIVAEKNSLAEKYFSVKWNNHKTLVKSSCKYIYQLISHNSAI